MVHTRSMNDRKMEVMVASKKHIMLNCTIKENCVNPKNLHFTFLWSLETQIKFENKYAAMR